MVRTTDINQLVANSWNKDDLPATLCESDISMVDVSMQHFLLKEN